MGLAHSTRERSVSAGGPCGAHGSLWPLPTGVIEARKASGALPSKVA